MTLAMALAGPRTSLSLGTGPECFLAHAGSASIVSGLRAGAVPAKVTVPVTDEATASTAAPGLTDIAISPTASPAANNKLFPVQRMLSSLEFRFQPKLYTRSALRRRLGYGGQVTRSRRPVTRQASGHAVEPAPAGASASSPPRRRSRRRRRTRPRPARTD